MKFLFLIHGDEREWSALSDAEQRRVRTGYGAFARDAAERGKLLRAGELQATDRATTVRVKDGETLVTDGPYAETKEALGGYFLVECESIDEAVELGKRLPPPAAGGCVEIRPVHEEGGES